MSDFSDIWTQAGKDDWEPPAGGYTVQIIDGSAFQSQDGRHFCKVRLRVQNGAYAGEEFEHFMGFSSAVSARISRAALGMYGLNEDAVRDFSDLKGAISSLRGTTAEVVVKHKDGYINTEVVRTITGESDLGRNQAESFQTTPADAANDTDDDVPY